MLAAEGDPKAALVELRKAFNDFNSLGVRYDAARSRLLIADACTALGDHDTAAMESGAARAGARSACIDRDSAGRGRACRERQRHRTRLTGRELEVLRLLARGKTNRGIADELIISEKTVASHVSHILTKLSVTSRGAATAYAYDHNLVH